jgi:hypothetical protein
MGDLALTENEVNDVISAFQAGGIEQTAVHNHLLRESPRVAYVHFEGHRDRVSLARTLRAALEKTKTPLTTAPSSQPDVDLPTADLDRIIGASGKANGGVYNSPSRGPRRSSRTGWRSRRRWGWPQRSTFKRRHRDGRSQPATS